MSSIRRYRWIIVAFWAFVIGINLPLMARDPWLLGELVAWLAAALILHIVWHELGHAVVGGILGFRVLQITSGIGPALFAFNVGRVRIEQRSLPMGGATRLATRDPDSPGRLFRVRLGVAMAAGPLATLALALAATTLIPGDIGLFRTAADGTQASIDFAGIVRTLGFLLVLTNLLPWPAQTDGGRLRWLVFASHEDQVDYAQQAGAAETEYHFSRGDFDSAIKASESVETNSAAIVGRSAALSEAGMHDEARHLILEHFDTPMPDHRRAYLANNLAWADSHLGTDLLPEADRMSALAIELTEEPQGGILSTRGRVLRLTDRPTEAIDHLTRAMSMERLKAGQVAMILADRSLARIDTEDWFGALTDADQAYDLDPTHAVVIEAGRAADLGAVRVIAANATDRGGNVHLDPVVFSPTGRPMVDGARRALHESRQAAGLVLIDAGWPANDAEEASATLLALIETANRT